MNVKNKIPVSRQYIIIVVAILILQMISYTGFSQYRQVYNGTDENNTINGMSFLSPSTGFVAFTEFIGFTTDSGRSFVQHKVEFGNTDYNGYTVNLTFGFYAQGVKAFTRDSLFAYGHFGTEPSILFSANGGANWKVVFHRDLNTNAASYNQGITDMVFPDNGNTAFAVHHEEVLTSSDRGQTWRVAISVPLGNMQKLSFPSAITGYAIGGNNLYKTVNKGASWLPVTLPGDAGQENFNNISFPSLAAGYISDYTSGLVYKTPDGGTTWKKMNEYDPFQGTKMYFTNDSTGYITSEFTYDVYKTTDSGAVWEQCKRIPDYQYLAYGLNGLYFLDKNTGWAGGKKEYLIITTNGGGQTKPRAIFTIDTTAYDASGQVHLVNHSKKTYQYKWYVNSSLVSTSYNAVYSRPYVASTDEIKLIVSNGTDSDSAVQSFYFKAQPIPNIRSFSPKAAAEGSLITINGDYFYYATTVSFGGVPASSFVLIDDTTIQAIVGKGASGAVATTSVHGSTSLSGFTYLPAPTAAPPVIISFSPNAGPVGTTVTITGTNFNTSPSGNLVLFGGVKASVSSASATKIVCLLPPGASSAPPSVLNTATHLAGYANQPFNITFADSSKNFTSHSFEKVYPDYLGVFNGQLEWSTVPCDVDGDGKIDMASSQTCRSAMDSLVIFRNVSTTDNIGFEPGKNIGPRAGFLATADIDGDGKIDFVTIDHGNQGAMFIVRNTSTPGNISADPAIEYPHGFNILPVFFTDFDDDGRPDMASPHSGASSVLISKNTSLPGNISMTAGTYFSFGGDNYQLNSITAGDLDGDGKKDIIAVTSSKTDPTDHEIRFLKNTSSNHIISFAAATSLKRIPETTSTSAIFLNDMDGDGVPDVVVGNLESYAIYKNTLSNGTINLQLVDSLDLSYLYGNGTLVDNLDGDGKPDLGYATQRGPTLYLKKNLSQPGSVVLDRTEKLYTPAVGISGGADFNNDGKEDIWSGDGSEKPTISIYINKIGKPVSVNMCTVSSGFFESDVEGNSYQWQEDTGKGFANISDDAHFQGAKESILNLIQPPGTWNGYRFRCIADGHISSVFLPVISSKPTPVITISTKDSVICPGDTVVIDAVVKNTDSTSMYEWLENGDFYGNDSTQYRSSYVNDGEKISLLVYSRDACFNTITGISNTITIRQTGQAPELNVNASDYSLCYGKEVTYTATITGSVSNPGYQWTVNGNNVGTNNAVYKTSTLKQGDVVQVKVTTGATSCFAAGVLSSDPITADFLEAQPLTVSISASDSAICGGKSVTFTPKVSVTTFFATYQWLLNDVQVSTSDIYYTSQSLQNNDKVKLVVKDNTHCYGQTTVTSNIITMNVGMAAADAGIDKTVCNGEQVTIGGAPSANNTYSWASAPNGYTSSQSMNNVSPSVTTTYIVTAASNGCSAKDSVLITVSPSISISGLPASPITVCKGNPVSIGIPEESGFTYNWTSQPAGFASSMANPSVSPVESTTYTLTKTSAATGCSVQDEVKTEVSDCASEVKMFPNPATSYATIETDLTDLQNVYLELFDSRGKSILVQRLADSKTVRVSGFATGIYKYVIRKDGTVKGKGTLVVEHH